jgi:hypothetical protein
MSGDGAMDEMERAGTRSVRRALRARRPLGRRDHKRRERARKKSGCGGEVSGLVELVLSSGGICVRYWGCPVPCSGVGRVLWFL